MNIGVIPVIENGFGTSNSCFGWPQRVRALLLESKNIITIRLPKTSMLRENTFQFSARLVGNIFLRFILFNLFDIFWI